MLSLHDDSRSYSPEHSTGLHSPDLKTRIKLTASKLSGEVRAALHAYDSLGTVSEHFPRQIPLFTLRHGRLQHPIGQLVNIYIFLISVSCGLLVTDVVGAHVCKSLRPQAILASTTELPQWDESASQRLYWL